jgi:hypothetical protein
MLLKWPLSFLFYFPITLNEYPKGTHKVSNENFTLCKTLEGRFLLDQAWCQIGKGFIILVKITP